MNIIGALILSAVVILCCGAIAYCDITIIKEIRNFKIVMQELIETMENRT